MTPLDHALAFASRGFYVFPCRINDKKPLHKGWQEEATRDPETIRQLWRKPYNVGISTGKFGEGQALVVVDVDTKEGKRGNETLLTLELGGAEFPQTLEHKTPSEGRHLIYVSDFPCRQGTDVLGSGLDIRSRGGYVLAPGSSLDGKVYSQIDGHSTLVPAPEWLALRLGADRGRVAAGAPALSGIDPARAKVRAIEILKAAAPAVQGAAGDATTYKLACQLKDAGCSKDQAAMLMDEFWNERCSPPWSLSELDRKVANAYAYGREPQGSQAIEVIFDEAESEEGSDEPKGVHPIQKFNEQFAFTPAGGGHVIWETTDPKNKSVIRHLDLATFHTMFAAQKIQMGDKAKPISKMWLESPTRRSYDGFVFAPERQVDARWYNLWRGFSVQPAASGDHPAVKMFCEHALENVCHGEQKLYRWLMGYFAHMVQRPWEKPLTALVFKGRKGTGKNALIERIGYLLGGHFILTSKRRYLVGQFNGHLENCLCMTLDEAFWSGDKESEGVLKDLVTGTEHVIEHKGKESFKVDNLTRVVILGNERWLVPASQDERRYAVFELGEGRMQDRAFFETMRVLMEQGGYPHLLKFLQDFDLAGIDLNQAPDTQALTDQKVATLDPLPQWWMDCLSTGQIAGGDFGGDWPDDIPTNRLRDAYFRWMKNHNIRSRPETDTWFGRELKRMAPGFAKRKTTTTKRAEGDTSNHYHTPGLEILRQEFESFMGGTIQWTD